MLFNTATFYVHTPRYYFRKIFDKIVKSIQYFWNFSLYYGEFVATPVWERSVKRH